MCSGVRAGNAVHVKVKGGSYKGLGGCNDTEWYELRLIAPGKLRVPLREVMNLGLPRSVAEDLRGRKFPLL